MINFSPGSNGKMFLLTYQVSQHVDQTKQRTQSLLQQPSTPTFSQQQPYVGSNMGEGAPLDENAGLSTWQQSQITRPPTPGQVSQSHPVYTTRPAATASPQLGWPHATPMSPVIDPPTSVYRSEMTFTGQRSPRFNPQLHSIPSTGGMKPHSQFYPHQGQHHAGTLDRPTYNGGNPQPENMPGYTQVEYRDKHVPEATRKSLPPNTLCTMPYDIGPVSTAQLCNTQQGTQVCSLESLVERAFASGQSVFPSQGSKLQQEPAVQIQRWPSHEIQSNPGAQMQRPSLYKELHGNVSCQS